MEIDRNANATNDNGGMCIGCERQVILIVSEISMVR